MTRRILFAGMLLLALPGLRPALADTPPAARFESAACPFKVDLTLDEGKDLRCGYLTVPENRSVSTSKTIRLAVAILKSAAAHPAPDPVFYLNGGPGGNTLAAIGPALDSNTRTFWGGDRDLVLIDQRGTGYSTPNLQCPEIVRASARLLGKHMSARATEKATLQATSACRARLVRSGVDLAGYTSVENAHDIADLRIALGYSEINLYGISYGTRLALTVMRYFPQGIRSVVLDSVYGPTVNTFTDPIRSAARDFNLVINSCSKATICKHSYPHLRRDFYALVRRLDKKPVTLHADLGGLKSVTVVVSGARLLSTLFQSLYFSGNIDMFPYVVTRAFHRNYLALETMLPAVVRQSGGGSLGMTLSVQCSEDAPGTTQADIAAAARALPSPLRPDSATFGDDLSMCTLWNVPAVAPAQKQPVSSDIPTMVMEGEYDPITPPAYGALVARTLSKSFSFVYPGLGHGTRFGAECPSTMMWQFIDDPVHQPDNSCIATMHEPFG